MLPFPFLCVVRLKPICMHLAVFGALPVKWLVTMEFSGVVKSVCSQGAVSKFSNHNQVLQGF